MNQEILKSILQAEYVFAKTMPNNPHYYTLKKKWPSEKSFYDAVLFIRKHGKAETFKGSPYICLDVNGLKFWTMGDPLETTWLINKKILPRNSSDYDRLSEEYDNLFISKDDKALDSYVFDLVNYSSGSILDIGCGTGLFLDLLNKEANYTGIDPSSGMLEKCYRKHQGMQLFNCKFESFAAPQNYDCIVSLFGSFSYIKPESIINVWNMLQGGGKAFLMLYADDYEPETYKMCGVRFNHYKHTDYIKALYGIPHTVSVIPVSGKAKYITITMEKK